MATNASREIYFDNCIADITDVVLLVINYKLKYTLIYIAAKVLLLKYYYSTPYVHSYCLKCYTHWWKYFILCPPIWVRLALVSAYAYTTFELENNTDRHLNNLDAQR